MKRKIKQTLCCVVAFAAVWPSLGDGHLGEATLPECGRFSEATLPVEVYEKGGGDVDCAAKYSVQEKVREAKGAPDGCRLFTRLVKVTNLSNETRAIQVAVRAATAFKPANWVIPGVIYGDNKFGSQVSPSGLERDGEPWVFGYDRATIPSCTISETKDVLFAMFASQRFMAYRLSYQDAVKRGDRDFADWCVSDLDEWVAKQAASGLAPTSRYRKGDRLSVTELGWGVGEIAKMWKVMKDGGVDHPSYLEFARRLADFFVAHYDDGDPFGRIWSLKTGRKIDGGGDGGGFMVKGLLELHAVCGDRRYLDCARKAFDRYFEMDLGKFRCVAGADDCNCVDKESSFPYIYSALELYRRTGERKYLACAERVAAYFCSWMMTYDALYPPTSEFGRFGYHTSGGTLVSAEHPCIDPYATVAVPDLFDLADATGNEVWREAGRLIWVNAMQDVAGPNGCLMNGLFRTPGAQCEAHAHTRWAKYRSDPIAARGNFNNHCTAFLVTFRLYALDRVGDPMKWAE